MRRQGLILTSVNSSLNTNAQSADMTPDALYFANLAGLRYWVDPDAIFNLAGKQIDRVADLEFAPTGTITTSTVLGQPMFNFADDGVNRFYLNDDESASDMPDPETAAYTVVTVIKPNAAKEVLQAVTSSAGVLRNGVANQRRIYIQPMNESIGVAHYAGGTEVIVGTSGGAADMTKTFVLTSTYSKDTLRMFVNQAQVLKSPIGYCNPRGAILGSDGGTNRYFGQMGYHLEMDKDYGTDAMRPVRQTMIAKLMQKYSIA